MPKVSMKCLKPMVYAGHRLNQGDQFAASGESDARVLSAIKKAERYTPPAPVVAPPAVVAKATPVKAPTTYSTRALTAAVPSPAPAAPTATIAAPAVENAGLVSGLASDTVQRSAAKKVAAKTADEEKPKAQQYQRRDLIAGE